MKKTTIIISSLIILAGVIFYSCTKENSINNTQNKPIINNNKGGDGIERLFDKDYIQELKNISGIDPQELSKSKTFIDYYNNLQAVNECFRTKFLTLLQTNNTQAEYFKTLLQNANNSFINGDTINGLNTVNQVYTEIGCLSQIGFNYNNSNYNIPLFIDELRLANKSYSLLLDVYPNLNKIDEKYKIDILTIAIYWYSEGNDSKTVGPSCSSIYNAACAHAFLEACGCAAAAAQLVWPPAVVVAEIACTSFYVYTLCEAYNNYKRCIGQ